MTSELLDHFRNPRNVGELPAPAITVEVSNPACGDVLRLSVLWDGDRVALAAYKTRGCTASIAAGSALTEFLQGRTASELAALGPDRVESLLGSLPVESKHAAALCADAVKVALRASALK